MNARWVGPVLVSERTTDDRFLPNLLRRTIDDLCGRFSDVVDVQDVLPVRSRGGPSSIAASVEALRANGGSYNLVIYHHDAGANRDRVDREWLAPMRAAWEASGSADPLVFVVPMRETESWALADGKAIRRAYGVSWTDDRLDIPADPRDVRYIADPKKVFASIIKATRGKSVDYHSRLGELISLDRLARVEAFAEWRADMAHVLEHDIRLTRQG